jgi:hypothetical protein
MMEAASTSEISVNFYQITQPNNSEDSHLHTCRRQNLKAHNLICKHTFFPVSLHIVVNASVSNICLAKRRGQSSLGKAS